MVAPFERVGLNTNTTKTEAVTFVPEGEEGAPGRVPRVPRRDGSRIAEEPLGDTARCLPVLRGAGRRSSGVRKRDDLDGLLPS